ncbi:hypothetical protein HYS94_00945 [Candidatus Daviesbacteria bacterium]|nr:hypothetical protein [Candidatus Daviesbacteria bacterium]
MADSERERGIGWGIRDLPHRLGGILRIFSPRSDLQSLYEQAALKLLSSLHENGYFYNESPNGDTGYEKVYLRGNSDQRRFDVELRHSGRDILTVCDSFSLPFRTLSFDLTRLRELHPSQGYNWQANHVITITCTNRDTIHLNGESPEIEASLTRREQIELLEEVIAAEDNWKDTAEEFMEFRLHTDHSRVGWISEKPPFPNPLAA